MTKLWFLAAIGLTFLHFLLMLAFFEPAVSSPDANGYLTQARLIAESGQTWFDPASPLMGDISADTH